MGPTIKPDQFLIVVGCRKGGTTSLFEYLSEHPAVCPSVLKEPGYFKTYSNARRHAPNVVRYEDLWPDFDLAVHSYALEGSPGYTRPDQNGVAERMRAYGIQPRLIYLVRDPVERIESDVNYQRIMSRRPASFNDPLFLDISRYATRIAPFVETFGRANIRVVTFDRLRTEPNQVCAELYDWLGLEPYTIADPAIWNETASIKQPQAQRMMEGMRVSRILPSVVKKPIKRAVLKLFPSPYQPQRVRLSPERTREIRKLLQGDMARLAVEWGVDVSPWGFE
jgi:hypothetical protein